VLRNSPGNPLMNIFWACLALRVCLCYRALPFSDPYPLWPAAPLWPRPRLRPCCESFVPNVQTPSNTHFLPTNSIRCDVSIPTRKLEEVLLIANHYSHVARAYLSAHVYLSASSNLNTPNKSARERSKRMWLFDTSLRPLSDYFSVQPLFSFTVAL
jgi:hypothetical protein